MAVNNSLARQDQSMKLSVYLQNDAVKKQINQVVGGKNGTRFISSIVSAVQSTPALQECTSPSIVNAALLGEALNLSPSPQLGQFYMVPFDNKKKGCKEAQFQLGYKGYIQLAIRSGYYKKLNVLAIKEGELVRYDPLDEEVEVNLIDDDILREEAPTMDTSQCSSMRMVSGRPCTGQRRKCLHTLRSILLRFTKTVEQNLWNYWNRARFRKRICGSILHSGLRILTEWH